MEEYAYKKLRVYEHAKLFVIEVYKVLEKFPVEERYALCDQLRRASISVPSNIAEGMSRTSDKDKAHFLEMSYGSLMETQCQLDIAKELGYIETSDLEQLNECIASIAQMLSGLRAKFINH